ncbi:DUF5958 family protein [Flavobacterium collinsii]|uniref:DUF5958 family protein n=1 Tax=Flavobacterium collinsii TaxID=1114861 RepID=UPI003757BE06
MKEIFYILALIKAQYCKAIIYKNRIKNIFMYQMSKEEEIINKVAQDKIDFNLGVQLLLEDPDYDFERLFITLKNYIFNAIPEKTHYDTETYQNAINTIPLKSTYTPIVLLKNFPTRIAFYKLAELPENENKKVLISLLWIFKATDTERRNMECKNGCGHFWHEFE